MKNTFLGLEFVLLFFAVPLILLLSKRIVLPSSILLPALIFVIIILRKTRSFHWKELTYWGIERKTLFNHGLIAITCSSILFILAWVLDPRELFNLPRLNWKMWVALCIFYPVFSVLTQELLFRVFILKRYESLFPKPVHYILASAISFSFAHIMYFSVASVVLTLFLGLYLAHTYLKTRSFLFASVLHSVLGDFVFTVGLGHYFWLDMHRWLETHSL